MIAKAVGRVVIDKANCLKEGNSTQIPDNFQWGDNVGLIPLFQSDLPSY